MSYKNREKARTPKDRQLAIKHLRKTVALDLQKTREHKRAAASRGYTKSYNLAHAKDHAKDAKGAKKLLKSYMKAAKKRNKR